MEIVLLPLDKVKLNFGESLQLSATRSSGTMGQRETEYYEIVNLDGAVVGELEYEKDTSIKQPFKTTHMAIRKNIEGVIEFRITW